MARIQSEVQLYIIPIIYTSELQDTYQKDSNKWQRTPGGARLSRESPPECVAVRGRSVSLQQRTLLSARAAVPAARLLAALRAQHTATQVTNIGQVTQA